MKVIVVGGSGTIGKAVVKELGLRHEVISVGRKSGDLTCDFSSEESICKMYEKVGDFDAVIVCAGGVHFDAIMDMSTSKYLVGINDKLMGQVKLVLLGAPLIRDGGSFTLTSGVLSHDPVRAASSASMVNGAIDGFVRAAAIELPRQVRINAVSPTILTESMDVYGSYFRGFEPVSAARVALAYSKGVEGLQTGQIYQVT